MGEERGDGGDGGGGRRDGRWSPLSGDALWEEAAEADGRGEGTDDGVVAWVAPMAAGNGEEARASSGLFPSGEVAGGGGDREEGRGEEMA